VVHGKAQVKNFEVKRFACTLKENEKEHQLS
jgi:hypothetical protein